MTENDWTMKRRFLKRKNLFPVRMIRKMKEEAEWRRQEKLRQNPDFVDPEDYDTNDGKGWCAHSLFCVKCGERMVGVMPAGYRIYEQECPACHRYGFMIRTYEELFDEEGN